MGLQIVQRRSLADKVFGQLAAEIVSGRYRPGDAIPSERELSELLGVNRHVVREALKRLEQVGLVNVLQGGRTKVLDYRKSGGLDLLAVLAEHAESAEGLQPLLAAVLEMRAGIGAEVARLCAQRADRSVREDLLEISVRLAEVGEGSELMALDEQFWQRMLDGAGSLAYQLAFNSLIKATHARPDMSVVWLEQELRRGGYRSPVASAIAARDPEAAADAARETLTPAGRKALGRTPKRGAAR
jgi:DNA-binding FadR family transcriptional regulator